MSKQDGGPAFPSKGKINRPRSQIYPNATGSEVIDVVNTGMTLRDYFAAKAMQGIIWSDKYMGVIGVNGGQFSYARMAYEMADAMLKAREEQ